MDFHPPKTLREEALNGKMDPLRASTVDIEYFAGSGSPNRSVGPWPG